MSTNIDNLILTLCLMVFFWGVLIPPLCYYTYQFYKLRNAQSIHKRYYKLSIAFSGIAFIGIAFLEPLLLLNIYFISIDQTVDILEYIAPIFYTLIAFSALYVVMLRFWLLFYFTHWTS